MQPPTVGEPGQFFANGFDYCPGMGGLKFFRAS